MLNVPVTLPYPVFATLSGPTKLPFVPVLQGGLEVDIISVEPEVPGLPMTVLFRPAEIAEPRRHFTCPSANSKLEPSVCLPVGLSYGLLARLGVTLLSAPLRITAAVPNG